MFGILCALNFEGSQYDVNTPTGGKKTLPMYPLSNAYKRPVQAQRIRFHRGSNSFCNCSQVQR